MEQRLQFGLESVDFATGISLGLSYLFWGAVSFAVSTNARLHPVDPEKIAGKGGVPVRMAVGEVACMVQYDVG